MEERIKEAIKYCEEEIEHVEAWKKTPSWDCYEEYCIEAEASEQTCKAILEILKGE